MCKTADPSEHTRGELVAALKPANNVVHQLVAGHLICWGRKQAPKKIGKDPATLREWPEYAKRNNIQAVEFVRQSPAGDDHVYVLTTSSWRELGKIKELKKKG